MLAPTYNETAFVIDHISEMKMFVEVIFLGDQLKAAISYLHSLYVVAAANNQAEAATRFSPKYLFLYRTPSEIVYDAHSYEMITMPRCDEMLATFNKVCVYELMPILKFYSNQMRTGAAQHSIWNAAFLPADIEQLLLEFDRVTSPPTTTVGQWRSNDIYYDERPAPVTVVGTERIYNEMACEWLEKNRHNKTNWFVDEKKIDVIIGGIFPMKASGAIYSGMCVLMRHRIM